MALTANRDTPEMKLVEGIAPFSFPVAAAVKIYAGAIVVVDTAGNAKPGVTGTGLFCIGRAEALADNTSGAAGDISVEVKMGVYRFANYASDLIADTERFETCYVHDDFTVSKGSSGATKSAAGCVIDVDASGVWVGMGFEALLAPVGNSGLSDNTAADVNGTAGSAGVAVGISRSDHVHFHGAQTVGTLHAAATATVNGFMTAAQKNKLDQSIPVYTARGVAIADIPDLAAFVVSNNGITYVAGDIILLANQTTAAQCGLYLVGTVSGTAPLTRIVAAPAAAAWIKGSVVHVGYEGTLFPGSTWKCTATGSPIIGTNDPLFYPQTVKGTFTLASGTYSLGVTEGLFLKSTTTSSVVCTLNTAGGTVTLTVGLRAASASRTAGKSGTGVVTVIAIVAAGTINTADNSTVDYCITNW